MSRYPRYPGVHFVGGGGGVNIIRLDIHVTKYRKHVELKSRVKQRFTPPQKGNPVPGGWSSELPVLVVVVPKD
jgi:hypothetical protein